MNRIFPKNLQKNWNNSMDLLQVLIGPRQVGKTTAILELAKSKPTHYVSADSPLPPTAQMILDEWEKAKNNLPQDGVFIFDEIQKIPRWSEAIKKIWDERVMMKSKQSIWILGSSALLLEKGLSESLTGRFELNHFPHWTFGEVESVLHRSLYDYVYWGGYPKVYSLNEDEERANDYIQNSIIETSLGRDILSLHSIEKPALLRQLFWYISRLPAQMVSYEKIMGALQGKGNTATLAHYAELLKLAFLVIPIFKFSQAKHRTKKSIPKWILPNPVLVDISIKEERLKNFTFENLIGSHLLNLIYGKYEYELNYWNENGKEIDFILCKRGVPIWAFEVKSGRSKKLLSPDILEKSGIHCPYLLIHPENVEKFLRIDTLNFESLQLQ
jgi:uncharacterized protein